MANSSRIEKGRARATKPACAGADSVDRNLPAQLYVDNTVLGVNVRIPDPADGDDWIASAVSLTAVTDACDG